MFWASYMCRRHNYESLSFNRIFSFDSKKKLLFNFFLCFLDFFIRCRLRMMRVVTFYLLFTTPVRVSFRILVSAHKVNLKSLRNARSNFSALQPTGDQNPNARICQSNKGLFSSGNPENYLATENNSLILTLLPSVTSWVSNAPVSWAYRAAAVA